jgi:hypothetical protein
MSEGPMNLWQVICYGADDAAMAALCYFRARGWAVDAQVYPEREECEDRIYSFICGYETAIGLPR